MHIRECCRVIPVLVAVAVILGCKKQPAEERADRARQTNATAAVMAPVPETVASIHWIGSKALGAVTNAAHFKKVWELPETTRLLNQTLDKLAIGLAKGYPADATNLMALSTNYPALLATNRTAGLLRPLLQDLLENEAYFEARQTTNSPGEFALALRVDESRSMAWGVNLREALQALYGLAFNTESTSSHSGWTCTISNFLGSTREFTLSRSGGWTLLALSAPQSTWLPEWTRELQAAENPPSAQKTNFWYEITLSPGGLTAAVGLTRNPASSCSRIWLASTGHGDEVFTQGRLTLANPLPDQLSPWILPTNLINEPLHSFTAVRGFGPWLSQQPFWKELQVGEAPEQVFTWAQTGTPFLDYLAAPLKNASNVVEKLGERIMHTVNPVLASNRMGQVERSTNFHGFVLSRVPVMMPFLRDETLDSANWLHAGVAPVVGAKTHPPQDTIHKLVTSPDLVYFDSELTGPRTEAWLYLSQISRILLRRYQLPPDVASIAWIKAAGPLIGPSTTSIAKQGASDLFLERTSSLGLTGMEIHLLVDWLESPLFPAGSHTRLARLPPPRFPPSGAPQPK